ncbi:lysozyme inhibitor LprI family protein [Serratia sp. DD3]|uniref:lysozyme inhibitor LprI family protein n=1 Tax=Serratia sp. DD3 TaxID=1410619 RepID=UPI0004DA5FAE|nr:lysozyme inhibitor LprI family protein [Serratia sp. DD3]KEY56961.1 hypothetical protein SRDD_42100 [Serratia sp. DD3]
MDRMVKTAIMLLLLVSPPLANAKGLDTNIDETLAKCTDSVPQRSSAEMAACYNTAVDAWQAEIDKQLQLMMQDRTENELSALKKMQTAWVEYKKSSFQALDVIFSDQQQWPDGPEINAFFKMIFLSKQARQLSENYFR